MNRFALFLAATLALAAGLGCASSLDVQRDYDPQYSFSGLRTYAWVEQTGGFQGEAGVGNQLIDRRIHEAVDRALAAKGYQQSSSDPDFIVAYHAAAEDKLDVYTTYDYYGYGYGWRAGVPRTEVREFTEGTIVIDVVDPSLKQLVWRGTGTGVVRGGEPDEVSRRIDEAVAQVLADFPPTQGG
jgi:hypothetical protein